MNNHYIHIEDDGLTYFDGVFGGVASFDGDTEDERLAYFRERAEEFRHSDLKNYDFLDKPKREQIAKLWECARLLPKGRYDYYFNLENKYYVFAESVKQLADKLGIEYELTIK